MSIVNGCIHIFYFFSLLTYCGFGFLCIFGQTTNTTIMKSKITSTQKSYLLSLKKELKNLEILGKSNSTEWWSIVESIDGIENNF